MAELTGFGYRPSTTLLHQLDSRGKLIALLVFSALSMQAEPVPLAVLSAILALGVILLGMRPLAVFREFRLFLVFLVLIFLAQSLTTPGIPVFPDGVLRQFFPVTRQGAIRGSMFCWRLFTVAGIGLIFTASTKTRDIRFAVSWFLKPVPFFPEQRIATMISLLIRFLPEILRQARECRDAQRARCVELRKNPVFRAVRLILPLLRSIFERADKLSLAMQARGYSENRDLHRVPLKRADKLFVLSLFCTASIFLILL
jgi:energy-coupling factor transporter transmembrane protein EcfT